MLDFKTLFSMELSDVIQLNNLITAHLEAELKSEGVVLTNDQITDIEEQLLKSGNKSVVFDFSDQQIHNAGYKSEAELKPVVNKIFEEFPDKIDKLIDDPGFVGIIKLLDRVGDRIADDILDDLVDQMNIIMERRHDIYTEFMEVLEQIWQRPLGLFQGFIFLTDEITQVYNSMTNHEGTIVDNLLLRLQAKAIQISQEVFTLITNGFSDGAQARWRTLHEISVVSAFISEHNETVAERYIDHEFIDAYKAAKQHNDFYIRLGLERVSDDEMKELSKRYNNLLMKYGNNYRSDYGWAAEALNIKKPTFRDIEASVELDHLRPYYKNASAFVHGNSTGVFNSLGTPQDDNIILSGPSQYGLEEAAQSTIISLNLATTTLLTHRANTGTIIICKALAKFLEKIEEAFLDVVEEVNSL